MLRNRAQKTRNITKDDINHKHISESKKTSSFRFNDLSSNSKRKITCALLATIIVMMCSSLYLASSSHSDSVFAFLQEVDYHFQSSESNIEDDGSVALDSDLGSNNEKGNNKSWPSNAIEGVGYPLVKKGTNFVDDMYDIVFKPNKNGKILIEEFIQVYKNRPDKVNICGIRFNHALALFVAVRRLNPRLVIESGVNTGQSTYFIRKAKKDIEIISLEPEEKPICGEEKRWVDKSGKTKYYVGKDFVDISEFDWVGMSKNGTITPSRTLVFLDDHQEVIQRLPALMKAGISHLIVEDNYKRGEGATQMDRDGQTPKQLFAFRRRRDNGTLRDADWLFNNLISYAEFPPLAPPIMSEKYSGVRKAEGGFMFHTDTNADIMAPLLRSDLNQDDLNMYRKIVKTLGFDPELKDDKSYMQFMNYNQICYLELLPMAWRIVDKW